MKVGCINVILLTTDNYFSFFKAKEVVLEAEKPFNLIAHGLSEKRLEENILSTLTLAVI